MKSSSILVLSAHVSFIPSPDKNIPLLRHHKQTLHQQALHNLGSNPLEETQWSLPLGDVAHDLAKGLEWLPFPARGRTRLETDLGDDQRLGCNGGKRL